MIRIRIRRQFLLDGPTIRVSAITSGFNHLVVIQPFCESAWFRAFLSLRTGIPPQHQWRDLDRSGPVAFETAFLGWIREVINGTTPAGHASLRS